MIKNKRYFFLFVLFFVASMSVNFPFPDDDSYGELVSVMGKPVKTVNGVNFVACAGVLLFVLSAYFLVKSLKKYHIRFVLLAMFAAVLVPLWLIDAYQSTVATGIYAIDYAQEESQCQFDMTNKTNLHVRCELPFENRSHKEVSFMVEFYKQYPFEEDAAGLSLMNQSGPYEVKLSKRESKRVKLETNIDVSKVKSHIESGEMRGVNIIIKSGGKIRKL